MEMKKWKTNGVVVVELLDGFIMENRKFQFSRRRLAIPNQRLVVRKEMCSP